jgi:hypothetical protein
MHSLEQFDNLVEYRTKPSAFDWKETWSCLFGF